MHEQKPRTVPWIERVAQWVPGYGGYLERGNRRAADQALRDVVAAKLTQSRTGLEQTIRMLVDRGELNKLAPLERVGARLDRLASRIKTAGSGTSEFQGSDKLDPQKADALHAFDFDLLERVETLAKHLNVPDHDGDWLAHVETDLDDLQRKLDERTSLLQGIH